MNMLHTLSLHLYIGPLAKSIKQLQACDTKPMPSNIKNRRKKEKIFKKIIHDNAILNLLWYVF